MRLRSDDLRGQARRYLRWFPAWTRGTRGEEAVGLVLDLLPDDVARLPWRSRLDLLHAAAHAQRVALPPPWVWMRVAYSRPHGRAIPAGWLPWLSGSVRGRWFPTRVALTRSVYAFGPMLPLLAGSWGEGGRWWRMVIVLLLVGPVLWFQCRSRRFRAAVCALHGLAEDGRMRPPGSVHVAWTLGPVSNLALRPWLDWIAASAAVAAIGMTWSAAVHADTSLWEPAARGPLAVLAVAAAMTVGWASLIVVRAVRSPRAYPEGWPIVEPAQVEAGARRHLAWWAQGVASVAIGAGLAWIASWVASALAVPLVALGPGVLLGLAAFAIGRAEVRSGRRIGLWDALPQWAPQPVVVTDGGNGGGFPPRRGQAA